MNPTFTTQNMVGEGEEENIWFTNPSPKEKFEKIPPKSLHSLGTSSGQSTDDDDGHLSSMSGGRRGVEISLRRMGYNNAGPVDWSGVNIPDKTDLHKLLHYKISNFIDPDILIKIGNHEYSCHLLVLQSYSKYFVENVKSRIELSETNVSKAAFTFIYEWMLQPGLDCYKLLRMDNILEVYMAAQFLNIEELVAQCVAFIDNEDFMSEYRAFALYLDARAMGNIAVMMAMVPRIQRFFLTLVASKEFLELSVDEVSTFLHSNFICIHCEMEVFMAAVRWLMWDWESRHQFVPQLMSYVRFGHITPWQLVDIRRNPTNKEFLMVTKDPHVNRMIEDGLAFAIVKHSQESANSDEVVETFGLCEPVLRNWVGTSRITNQKKYETYQDFLSHLSEYRRIHVISNKGKGDKVKSNESFEVEIENARKMLNSSEFITHHSRS